MIEHFPAKLFKIIEFGLDLVGKKNPFGKKKNVLCYSFSNDAN